MKRTNSQVEWQMDIDRRLRAGEYPSVPFLAAEWEVDIDQKIRGRGDL